MQIPLFTKRFILTATVIVFGFIAYRIWSHSTEISYYPDLAKANLPQTELTRLYNLKEICFLGPRKDRMVQFYQHKYPHANKAIIEQQVEQASLENSDSIGDLTNVYIARDQQNLIVGLFNCTEESELTHGGVMIYHVCVDPQMRGRGIGKNLIKHAITHCTKPGKPLALLIDTNNETAIHLYEKLGFKQVNPEGGLPSDNFNYFLRMYMVYMP